MWTTVAVERCWLGVRWASVRLGVGAGTSPAKLVLRAAFATGSEPASYILVLSSQTSWPASEQATRSQASEPGSTLTQ